MTLNPLHVEINSSLPRTVAVEPGVELPRPADVVRVGGKFDSHGGLILTVTTARMTVTVNWNYCRGTPELRSPEAASPEVRAYAMRLFFAVTIAAARVAIRTMAMTGPQFISAAADATSGQAVVASASDGRIRRSVISWEAEQIYIVAVHAGDVRSITYTSPGGTHSAVVTVQGVELAGPGRRYSTTPFDRSPAGIIRAVSNWLELESVRDSNVAFNDGDDA